MFTYIEKALGCLEQAFGPPVYCGDQPQPTLAVGSKAFLDQANLILVNGQARKGADAQSAFCLGIVHRYRHPAKKELFLSQMRLAHRYDPNLVEPAIASRDGSAYTDPFSYPSWSALSRGQASFPASVTHSPSPKTGKINLVRMGLCLIPSVIVKYPRASFHSPLTKNTKVDVLVDIDSVIPAMPAMMHVMPVIFDDYDDPFWQNHYLNLFPIEADIKGIAIHFPPDYQPWLGRDIARRFCQEPNRCALFVLDENNHLMMARLLEFEKARRERFLEMDQVLTALGNQKINYMVWKHSMNIHEQTVSKKISNPDGEIINIPKRPKPNLSEIVVFPIVAHHGKLMAKKADEDKSSPLHISTNDIFISYSHTDESLVKKVEKWLKKIWPFLKIYRTKPGSEKLFREDPLYFTEESIHSRCFVFLATPSSIDRAWVKAELGGAATQPVITLLAGGTIYGDLSKLFEDLYCKINPERVVDTATQTGWKNFAALLAETLDLKVPKTIPKGPKLSGVKVTNNPKWTGNEEFINDLMGMLKKRPWQTKRRAEALLQVLEREYAALAEKQGVRIRWDMLPDQTPRMRLATLLSSITKEAEIRKLLDMFPALVDSRMIAELEPVAMHTSQNNDEISQRFRKLLSLIREVVFKKSIT